MCADTVGRKIDLSPLRRPDLWTRAADRWFRSNTPPSPVPCPTCGYDLRRLPAPGGVLRCPECGTSGLRYRMMGRSRSSRLPAMAIAIAAGLTATVVAAWVFWESTFLVLTVAGCLLAWLAWCRIDRRRHGGRRVPPGLLVRRPARSGVDRALTDSLTPHE